MPKTPQCLESQFGREAGSSYEPATSRYLRGRQGTPPPSTRPHDQDRDDEIKRSRYVSEETAAREAEEKAQYEHYMRVLEENRRLKASAKKDKDARSKREKLMDMMLSDYIKHKAPDAADETEQSTVKDTEESEEKVTESEGMADKKERTNPSRPSDPIPNPVTRPWPEGGGVIIRRG